MKNDEDIQEFMKPEYLVNMSEKELNILPTEVVEKRVVHGSACTALALNSMGDLIATGGDDKFVKLWKLKNSQAHEIACLKGRSNAVCAMAFSLDNEYLAACYTDHRASIYNLRG